MQVPGMPQGTWLRVRVEAEPDKYLLGKAPKTRIELTDELARAVKSVPGTKVLVVTAESTPYIRVRQELETVPAAGVATIRLAQSIDDP
jgi:biopolymer transport protein ExbD